MPLGQNKQAMGSLKCSGGETELMYSKDREAGGWSVYARDYGEGIMVFTYDKDRNMIPVWFDRFHCKEFAKSVWHAQREYWDSLEPKVKGDEE